MKNKISKLTGLQFYIVLLVLGLFQSSSLLAETLEKLQECESCHMDQASEFEASVHYINRSGVQANCNKCHAYQKHENGEQTSKTVTKDRLSMAVSEWKRMSENDSKECKTCHSHMAMDLAKQEPQSVVRHEQSFDEGNTSCIECHKGISHHLPAGWKDKAKKLGLN